MGGFNNAERDKLLGLSKLVLKSVNLLALGYHTLKVIGLHRW
jgi:hypothetical protein